jgi:hypothetical protein
MQRLPRDDVIKAVDRADDVAITQIIGTNATVHGYVTSFCAIESRLMISLA